jgi:hypothetical protein
MFGPFPSWSSPHYTVNQGIGQRHQTSYREQHPPGVPHELGDPQQLPESFSAKLSEETLEVL